MSAAGLGVAFRAKPVVAAEARALVEHRPPRALLWPLRALLFAPAYRAEEIVAVPPGA